MLYLVYVCIQCRYCNIQCCAHAAQYLQKLKFETGTNTKTQQLPSADLGTPSMVFVLQRRTSPLPSIQMYRAWVLSPGSSRV